MRALWTGILIFLHSLELLLRHLVSVVRSLLDNWNPPFCLCIESETSRVFRLISTWTVGFVSASSRDRQQPFVDELRLGKLCCFLRRLCVFMWSQLHHCDGLFQNRQWHLHLDDLFIDSSKIGIGTVASTICSSANNRLSWCSQCCTMYNAAPVLASNF